MTTPAAAKICEMFAEFDDGATGVIEEKLAKRLLCELGDKLKPDEYEMMAKDAVKDGQFRYKWYMENVLCHAEGLGNHEHWLKQK